MLDAGPIFIMATVMILVFTIGLGDRENMDEEHVSAYSVFNRGCKSILGAMDVDDLVAQHVGGGWNVGLYAQQNDQDVDQRRNMHDNRRRQGPAEADAIPNPVHNAPVNNQARKSGKKLRRRNLEQRKEAQRQRQAAAALGFGGQDEAEAMNRLIEEQAAAIEDMDENEDGDLAAILAALED